MPIPESNCFLIPNIFFDHYLKFLSESDMKVCIALYKEEKWEEAELILSHYPSQTEEERGSHV